MPGHNGKGGRGTVQKSRSSTVDPHQNPLVKCFTPRILSSCFALFLRRFQQNRRARGVSRQGDPTSRLTPAARPRGRRGIPTTRPGYPLLGCFPAKPSFVSPGDEPIYQDGVMLEEVRSARVPVEIGVLSNITSGFPLQFPVGCLQTDKLAQTE